MLLLFVATLLISFKNLLNFNFKIKQSLYSKLRYNIKLKYYSFRVIFISNSNIYSNINKLKLNYYSF